jgi:hypothetical protein
MGVKRVGEWEWELMYLGRISEAQAMVQVPARHNKVYRGAMGVGRGARKELKLVPGLTTGSQRILEGCEYQWKPALNSDRSVLFTEEVTKTGDGVVCVFHELGCGLVSYVLS